MARGRSGPTQRAYQRSSSKPSRRTSSNGSSGAPPSGRCADQDPGWSLELDPSGTWERAVRSLASSLGENPDRLASEHWMRSLCRYYCGEEQELACVRAFEDVQERLATREAA